MHHWEVGPRGGRAAGVPTPRRPATSRLSPILVFVVPLLVAACGHGSSGRAVSDETAQLQRWSKLAVDCSGLDHTPSDQGPPHTFGEHLGPCRASRAMAIVHIAFFEVVNAIAGGYTSYVGLPRPTEPDVSLRAAIAQAGHDTLVALFQSQASLCDEHLAHDLGAMGDGPAKAAGIELGRAAAAAILQKTANDGSAHAEPRIGVEFIPSDLPGKWRPDPINNHPVALGALWADRVAPFVLQSASQFRCPPPPDLGSADYALAFDEAKVLGGDGVRTPTRRSADQTHAGLYWAYDGTPSLCAPPRLYNQIAVQLAAERGLDVVELARLLALVNVALADAGIAIWESKYFYQVWRPVAGIRESDPGTGPTGLGDGNAATVGDAGWTPLGAPASNSAGPSFTPPFPGYPSGHAGFGGALFQVLRRYFGTDDIQFTFVSDEFDGVTVDNTSGQVRPLSPRTFASLSEAEEENGQSRVYLGIHWYFDKTEGIAQGRRVADFVFDRVFVPQP